MLSIVVAAVAVLPPIALKSLLPPLILIAHLPVRIAVPGVDVLCKALAPLHRRRVAEPELDMR